MIVGGGKADADLVLLGVCCRGDDTEIEFAEGTEFHAESVAVDTSSIRIHIRYFITELRIVNALNTERNHVLNEIQLPSSKPVISLDFVGVLTGDDKDNLSSSSSFIRAASSISANNRTRS